MWYPCTSYVHVYTTYVHVYTTYVHGITSCFNRFSWPNRDAAAGLREIPRPSYARDYEDEGSPCPDDDDFSSKTRTYAYVSVCTWLNHVQ